MILFSLKSNVATAIANIQIVVQGKLVSDLLDIIEKIQNMKISNGVIITVTLDLIK